MISFFKLMGIASFIGIPASYFVSDEWLRSFIYKIELNWLIFEGSLALIITITIFTISFHSIKLATSNSMKPLKQE